VRRFLEEGNKVKITVRFRGREITHPETAQRQIEAIVQAVADIGAVETSARLEGRAMTAILSPRVKVTHAR
jgi:translation initiation factor IF-3